MKNIKRKAQEEMVGFVLIIVLVALIVLVFLGISLRKPAQRQASSEIESFLYSSMLYTTDCYRSQEIVYNLKDVIVACSNGEKCLDSRESCSVLNSTYSELIKESFKIGEEAEYRAFELKIVSGNSTMLNLKKGNFTGNRQGADVLLYGQDTRVILELYY